MRLRSDLTTYTRWVRRAAPASLVGGWVRGAAPASLAGTWIRRAAPASLAGGSVLLLAACAAPPDLTTLAPTPYPSSPTAAASSGQVGPGTPGDHTPAPEWTNTPSTELTGPPGEPTGSPGGAAPSGSVRPAGIHPQMAITLGENVDLTNQPGYPDIALTVVRVSRDVGCPQGPPPRLGQYVALDLIVRRTNPRNDNVGVTAVEWVALAPDGTETKTHGLSGFLCQRPEEQFPLRFGDREEIRGQLILDVPTDTATMSATIPWDDRAARLLIRLPDRD